MLAQPKFTRLRNQKLYEWLNAHALGKRVLNLGSGVGDFDAYLSEKVRPIAMDINPVIKGLDLVADAHRLPFKEGSIDIVYSIAVLEHVEKPWVVSSEITRVLKKGGYIALELPFLNVIHDSHDYFRFTDKGIRSLFDTSDYEVVFEQVGSGGASFLSVFLYVYLRQFIPFKIGKKLWNGVAKYPFSLLKYLDIPINRSRDLRLTANSFTFIGRKL
jgi:ubiquinone/menaquinone biosynthesis C-methylase UbiE